MISVFLRNFPPIDLYLQLLNVKPGNVYIIAKNMVKNICFIKTYDLSGTFFNMVYIQRYINKNFR
jgi:hypothetical protein